jgi:CRISPR-associated protein Cas1
MGSEKLPLSLEETLQASLRAKPLPRREPEGEAEPPIPARMVNEVLYCERLFYLEYVQGEFAHNFFTLDGQAVHKRADRPGGRLPAPPQEPGAGANEEHEGAPPYAARSVHLTSERLGLTAKIDVVEGHESGTVIPIEYKRGSAPDVPEGAYLPERAQLCAQVLLLRDHGYNVREAALYFAKNKRRVTITIDEELERTTLAAIARSNTLAKQAELPPPLVDSPKCFGCSLVGICLPDEVNLLRALSTKPGANENEEAPPKQRLRQVVPPRDDQLALYVQEQGARIGLDGDVLQIKTPQGEKVEARIPQTSQVCLMGNVQISTQAIRALLDRAIPISYFTTGGYFVGRTIANDTNNVELRTAQYRIADQPDRCLALARGWVASKIRNCRTLLRRNHVKPDPTVLFELEQLAKKAENCEALESLLGIEGTAARSYFGAFSGMLTAELGFELNGRNRRPPRDPVNALLSLGYALLAKELTIAAAGAGLDPLRGFYHQPRHGKPGLALDLMEEFRPLLADSTVLGVINQGTITPTDFLVHPTGVSLNPAARRRFILAYQRRLEQQVTHPIFGYRISYRRILDVQARLLGRVLLGEIPEYPAFRTR